MTTHDPAGTGSPIQIASQRTGLSPELLRKWEERYGAVRPTRGETGRRLYSDRDITRLTWLRQLTTVGWRISEIAGFDDARLLELLGGIDAPSPAAGPRPREAGRLPQAPELRKALVDAAPRFDPSAVHAVLQRAALALSVPDLLERVIAPALTEIGDGWTRGSLRCSQEHVATAAVRTFLGDLLRGLPPAPGAPAIVCGTPSGQAHELGALMAAITAATLGWRSVYLGPGLPAIELAYAAASSRARAVAVSLTWASDDPGPTRHLGVLADNVPADCVVFVGGAASVQLMPADGHPWLRRSSTLDELRQGLIGLREPAAPAAVDAAADTPASPSD